MATFSFNEFDADNLVVDRLARRPKSVVGFEWPLFLICNKAFERRKWVDVVN